MSDSPEMQMVVWTKAPWERRDYPTIMDGWVVRYNVNHGRPGEVEISASRACVNIHDVRIASEADGASLLDIIQRAWRQHLHLKAGNLNRPLPEVEQLAATNGSQAD